MPSRSRLTYERLAHSLEHLHGAVKSHFPDPKDAARARAIQRVIADALTAARKGVRGADVVSPVRMKREVEACVGRIHEEFEGYEEYSQGVDGVDGKGDCGGKDDYTESHASTGTYTRTETYSSPHHSTQKRSAPDSGKENTTPPSKTRLSAVKRKIVPGRDTCGQLSTAGVGKRMVCATYREPKLVSAPLSTPTPTPASTTVFTAEPKAVPTADDQDRRAAATALLNLSEHTPKKRFVSAIPVAAVRGLPGRMGVQTQTQMQTQRSSSTSSTQNAVQKNQIPSPGDYATHVYAAVPKLHAGLTKEHAFYMGVRYAVRQFSASGGGGANDGAISGTNIEVATGVESEGMTESQIQGKDLEAWVVSELGLQDDMLLDGRQDRGCNSGIAGLNAVWDQGCETGGGMSGRGFWDVV